MSQPRSALAVGLAMARIVLWKRLELQLRGTAGQLDQLLRQFEHCELTQVAPIDRAGAQVRADEPRLPR